MDRAGGILLLLELMACWPWSRVSGGWVRCGPGWVMEVSGVWGCCGAPLSRPVLAAGPVWEGFPEVNRVVAVRLLGVLVERMVRAAGGGNGGERGEGCGEAAVGAGRGQGSALAS
jgi:hypothetical protein